MGKTKRLFKSFLGLLLPIVLLIMLATISASVWLVHEIAHPNNTKYLVTPQKYGQLSSKAAQVTEETWVNSDGTTSRAWLLRGAENAPAVILLHKYGADRSHVLNLGVKLAEATNFTILMPDQRGHGENPTVKFTSFGGCESEDMQAAVLFLHSLKGINELPIVGQNIGIYGVEMGASAALSAASKDENITALVLDSVPLTSDSILKSAIDRRFPFASSVTAKFGELGTRFYYYKGCYNREALCDTAKNLFDQNILLLAGSDAPDFQDSTSRLNRCFPAGTIAESKTDLSPSGYTIINASIEQSEAYDQRVIDFFRQNLGN